MRELGEALTCDLGKLCGDKECNLASRCERLGKLCCEHQIPIDEAFRAMCLLRKKLLAFGQEHLISNSSMELYAQEALDWRIGRSFDRLTSHLRGFERG